MLVYRSLMQPPVVRKPQTKPIKMKVENQNKKTIELPCFGAPNWGFCIGSFGNEERKF